MKPCPHRQIHPLGEGAVGNLQLCVDVYRRRLVVVKWSRDQIAENSEAARRVHWAASRMMGREIHGVLKVEDYGSDEFGRTWMAAEFVDGLPPGDVIGQWDTWGVHRLLEGVGRSLDELHGLGVIHRNLKPENILLRSAGDGWHPVVIDLGIAKWLGYESGTNTGAELGTQPYMSPEQVEDPRLVGPATDLYALGIICFQLLTHELPYQSVHTLREFEYIRSTIPNLRIRPHGAASNDPRLLPVPNLDEFIQRAMAKVPHDRFGNGQEMADAFRDAAQADGLWQPRSDSSPLLAPLVRPILELRPSHGPARHFDMREGPVVLGRHEACQMILDSRHLTRLHACIFARRGRLWVADLKSQSGTCYQDKQLGNSSAAPLRIDGKPSRLRLYDQVIEVVCHAEQSMPEPPLKILHRPQE